MSTTSPEKSANTVSSKPPLGKLALLSLIFSGVALLILVVGGYPFSWLFAITGLVLGIIGLIRKSPPFWMSLTGLIAGGAVWLIGIIVAIVVAVTSVTAIATSVSDEPTSQSRASRAATATPEAKPSVAPAPVAPVEPAAPVESLSQSNARGSAADYLAVMAFSRQGLIDQLVYEGFSIEDATYGVDAVGADWYEQAALMAQEYLNTMSMSRQELVDQLMFEGFSGDEAEYGVSAVGY